MNSPLPSVALTGAVALPSLGVIRAQGEEAAKFLHGQLTQDFVLLGQNGARLAGFCSAKGRLLASFVGFKRAPDDILLVCGADVLPATLKRLSMFVMRAKLKLSDASEAFPVWGLAGKAVPAALDAQVWSKLDTPEGAQVVRLYPGAGVARALWVAPSELAAPDAAALGLADWSWLEVMSGVASISQPIVEAFVPQMLNLESVGGVNFKKGCYPGQEVVARSQFRGTLKRRAFIVEGVSPMAVGDEVFSGADALQPCGTVASVAPNPGGGWRAIASLQISAADAGGLHVRAADGPALSVLPLPYELLADV
jgi:folate-binding protein YgfZ